MDRFKSISASSTSSPLVNAETGPFRNTRELRQSPFWLNWFTSPDPLTCGSLIDTIDVVDCNILVTYGKRAVLYRSLLNEQPQKFASFELGTSRAHSLAYGGKLRASDGALLAFGSSDGRCRVFSVREGAHRVAIRELVDVCQRSENHRCAFRNQTQVLAAYDNGHLRLFDLSTGAVLQSLDDLHSDRVRAMTVSMDGNYCLTGSHDCSSALLDCRLFGQPSSLVARFQCESDPVLAVSFDANMEKVLLASGQQVQVFDMRSMEEPLFCLDCHHGAVLSVACASFSKTSKQYLLAGGMDNMLQFYDLAQGDHVHTVRMKSAITAIGNVCADPGLIAVGTGDGAVELVMKDYTTDADRKPKGLRSFEKKLKKFELRDTMEEVLGEGSCYKDFVDCLSALITIRRLRDAMYCVDMDRFLRLLAEVLRKLPGNADVLVAAASYAVQSIKDGVNSCERESYDLLKKAIDDEMELQVNLLRIQGVLDARQHEANKKTD